MNILVISTGIYPYKIGGAEIITYQVTNELKKNHNVYIEVRDKKEYMKYGKGKDIIYAYELLRKYKDKNIDIIHSHFITYSHIGFMLSKLLRCPFVIQIHGSAYHDLINLKLSVYEYFIKNSEGLIVPDLKLLERYKLDTTVIKIDIPIKRDFNLVKRDYILFVGRIHRVKRIELLLKAMSNPNLKHIKCIVAGIIENNSYYEELVKKSSENVEFICNPTRSTIFHLMKHAKIFVNTTGGSGIGITSWESMAMGTPNIIINNSGIQNEVINHKHVILTTPKNLLHDLGMLYYDKKLLTELGINGYNLTSNRDISVITKTYEDFYKLIIGDD